MHGLHQVRTRHPSDPIIPKGNAAPIEGALRAWAYALALVVFCLPLYSPDLFWHLNSGRWILEHFAVPRVDSFSFTLAGAPWLDFEWGTQIIWRCAELVGGLRALWVIKFILLFAAFVPVDALLRDERANETARAGALALWISGIAAQADLRADLSSAIFFAILLRRLHRGKGSFLFGFILFALWANLHAGFALGLVLYAIKLFAARLSRTNGDGNVKAELCGAVFGSVVNPYGLGIACVFLSHATTATGRLIMEWGAPHWGQILQRPVIAALVVTLAAGLAARARAPRFLSLAAAATGAATILSARFGIYFAAAGAALVFTAFPRPRATFVAFELLAATILPWPAFAGARWGADFDDRLVARRACDFVARERNDLSGLRLFNMYEWGGYLGWRLGPDGRVFGDGRYLFLDQLGDTSAALDSPEALASFVERERLDGLIIRRFPQTVATERVDKDGSRRAFQRPWYWSFLPRARWALVYWDEQALVFVDRAKAPAPWVAAHEYRWLLPGDEAALTDARSRGEVPEATLVAEAVRHAAEVPAR